MADQAWKSSGLVKGSGIPAPTGQYRVGCVDLMHQLEGDVMNGLLVRIHYPTDATPEAGYQYSLCFPNPKYIQGLLNFEKLKFSGILTSVITTFTCPRTPSLEEAPLLGTNSQLVESANEATPPVFPVIVFSHGLGAMRTIYSGIAADLSSHGYVVACVEHRDKSASLSLQRVPKPGGAEGELQDKWIEHEHLRTTMEDFDARHKQVKQRADEVRKSLDILQLLNEGAEIRNMMESKFNFKQFKGRMDISKAAVMGHSFGGATTVQTLSEDPRFKCGVTLDCWMLPIHRDLISCGISQPLYFINSYDFQWKENVRQMMSLTKQPEANGTTSCRVMTLIDTNHFNQSDVPFVLPQFLLGLSSMKSRLDGETAHRVNLDICHDFLKRYLLKDPAYEKLIPNLDGTDGHSEHIMFGTNLDLSDDTPKTEEEASGQEEEDVEVGNKQEGEGEPAGEEGGGQEGEGEPAGEEGGGQEGEGEPAGEEGGGQEGEGEPAGEEGGGQEGEGEPAGEEGGGQEGEGEPAGEEGGGQEGEAEPAGEEGSLSAEAKDEVGGGTSVGGEGSTEARDEVGGEVGNDGDELGTAETQT